MLQHRHPVQLGEPLDARRHVHRVAHRGVLAASVRADITQDDKRNEAYYAVRIRISDKELARLEGLQPMAGMPVEVFIKTSPRTVVSYLTKPLREQVDRAFRGR